MDVVWWSRPEGGPPEREHVVEVRNDRVRTGRLKPTGGIWTSPVDSEHGWGRWCSENMPDWLGSRYVLRATSDRLLKVESLDDLNAAWSSFPVTYERDYMARWYGPGHSFRDLDWEAMAREFDGFWLTAGGHWDTRMMYHPEGRDWEQGTYGWDCETVLWFRWCFDDVRLEPLELQGLTTQ